MELLKSLYGICNFEDYWYITFTKHLTNKPDLLAIPTHKEFFIPSNKKSSGVLGLLVDDTIVCGNENSLN